MPMARGLFSLLLAALLLCSCGSIRFVPVERVRTDTTYLTRVRHDSIYVRDSIFVYQKGDSVIKAVGGVATSVHLYGQAADVACDNPYELASLAKELNLPYDQMILYPTFVHFSHKLNGKQRKKILYNWRYKGKHLL